MTGSQNAVARVSIDDNGGSVDWPAPMPKAARNAVLSVFHAQGLAEMLTPDSFKGHPWREGEVRAALPHITAALADAQLTAEEVVEGIRLGWFQLWTFGKSALVSEMVLSPRCRALHVFAGGGDLAEMRELIPVLEAFAARLGCTVTGATGRRGWVRVLKSFGYAPSKHTTVERTIR